MLLSLSPYYFVSHLSFDIHPLLQSETFLVGEIKIGLTSTRERVAVEILRVFKEQCDPWGVTVERVEVEFYLKYQCSEGHC